MFRLLSKSRDGYGCGKFACDDAACTTGVEAERGCIHVEVEGPHTVGLQELRDRINCALKLQGLRFTVHEAPRFLGFSLY